jgi:Zn finger protein HypA/HybF involved in hydrogenase expression
MVTHFAIEPLESSTVTLEAELAIKWDKASCVCFKHKEVTLIECKVNHCPEATCD